MQFDELPWKRRSQGQVTRFRILRPCNISATANAFVHGSAMLSLSLVKRECSLGGHGQGHVSNFFIVDLENLATATRRYTGDIHNSVRSRFVYDTYRTMEATRSRHGWAHMFITHRPTCYKGYYGSGSPYSFGEMDWSWTVQWRRRWMAFPT